MRNFRFFFKIFSSFSKAEPMIICNDFILYLVFCLTLFNFEIISNDICSFFLKLERFQFYLGTYANTILSPKLLQEMQEFELFLAKKKCFRISVSLNLLPKIVCLFEIFGD